MPAFAQLDPDNLTPHQSGAVYLRVDETHYDAGAGGSTAYSEADEAAILLVGTTNDALQPANETETNTVEYPVKLYDCRLYLDKPSDLTTSVKLGSARSVTLPLTRPSNPTLCGPNSLVA